MSIFANNQALVEEIGKMQLGARPKVGDVKKGDKISLLGIKPDDKGEPRIEFRNLTSNKVFTIALISFAAMRICRAGAVTTAEWSNELKADDKVFNIQDLISTGEEGLKQLAAGAVFTCEHSTKVVNINVNSVDNVPTLTNDSYSGYPEFSRKTRAIFNSGADAKEINDAYALEVAKLQATDPKKPSFLQEAKRQITVPVFVITA